MIATKGLGAFVQPRYNNQIISIIDPKRAEENNNSRHPKESHKKILQNMGFEDTVVNHIFLMKDLAENTIKHKDIERYFDKSILSKRAFTVQCICNMEVLSLTQVHIDQMKKDFRTPLVKFIKQNI